MDPCSHSTMFSSYLPWREIASLVWTLLLPVYFSAPPPSPVPALVPVPAPLASAPALSSPAHDSASCFAPALALAPGFQSKYIYNSNFGNFYLMTYESVRLYQGTEWMERVSRDYISQTSSGKCTLNLFQNKKRPTFCSFRMYQS